ncbi:MAG: clostripain-related cysteine peptidase [Caldilineaceae bacterium]
MVRRQLHQFAAAAAVATMLLGFAAPRQAAAAPAAAPPAVPAAQAQDESEWLVMLYQNADDQILEGDIFTDLNESELVGSTDKVTIVSQFDRFDGAFNGDGDWTGTKRFLVTQDDDLKAIGSEELDDLGEVDSGAPETLTDFMVWAMNNYPAKKYALIMSDHGAGWMGGWSDNAPEEGSTLSVDEIDQAIGAALAETGVEQLEFMGFDACLMSQVEALSGIAPYARYAVASEEVEPAMGWAYSKFLGQLVDKPKQTGADLAKSVVNSYIVDDVRIQDDESRSEYVAQAYGVTEEVSAAEVGEAASRDVTLTAVDLKQLPAYMTALNDFAFALTSVDPTAVAQARAYAQSFENVFGEETSPSYLDVGNFAKLVAEKAQSDDLDAAVSALQKAAKKLILAETHGPAKPGATGLTFFFPAPELLVGVGTADSQISYTGYASRFAGASLWDDFLVFHYTNRDIDPEQADVALLEPETGREADLADYAVPLLEAPAEAGSADQGTSELAAPGVPTDLSLTPIEVSDESIGAGETTLLQTSISGENVAYIYVEAARYDEESDSYSIEDRDFVLADDTQDVDGVAYPVWTGKDLEDFIFEWSPTVYSISDGETEAFALLEPEVYGASDEDAEYAVYGVYTFADSGQERSAVMRFDGNMEFKNIFGFSSDDWTGAPRQITPQKGDQFTIYETWVEKDEDGNEVQNMYAGDTLTFGDQPFTVTAYDAYPGEYSVAITVEDLNGNTVSEYANVTVTD